MQSSAITANEMTVQIYASSNERERSGVMTTVGRFARYAVTLLVLGVALTQPTLQASAQPDRHVTIINRASRHIFHVCISNVDSDVWGPDQLGLYQTIPPNYQWTINVDDGTDQCFYDFKAVLSDGRSAVSRNVNVCVASSWTVRDW